ncbi:MAG TPA: tripartite tricarboxylate transporter substrate binding protein [Xanthobacteraceae bacterium]
MDRLFRVCAVLLATAELCSARPALAQSYPSRSIHVVVPFAAGGAVDTLARIIGAKLQDSIGQPVIIEDRAGAGGTTGADVVAKSPPDGYTILQNTNGQAIAPALYRSLPFDSLKDFAAVTQLVTTSTVLVANTKFPAQSLKELIALAKAKPGQLNYGMTGIGNGLHLTMELLKRTAGIDLQAVPYRGDAPLNTALMAGEIDVAIVPLTTIIPHIQAGSVRALAVTSAARSPLLPEVPTISEAAFPGFEASGWIGYFVPGRTPGEIIRVIQRETAKVLMLPEVHQRLEALGNEPVGSTPEEFEAKVRSDMARFAAIVKEAGIPRQD